MATPAAARPKRQPAQEQPEEHLQQGNAARARWYIRAFRLFVRTLFHIFFRVRVRGLVNVPHTPAIICANHLGWTDPFLVLLFFPVEPRVYVLAMEQVKEISGFRRWVLDKLEIMVTLEPGKPLHAIRTMEDVMRRGGSLLIFPEGELGTQEGTIRELQHGASHLSAVSGAPIVPVGLTGTSELWLRRALTMRVGRPIYPTEFEGNTRTRTHALTDRLEHEMRALLPGDTEGSRVKLLRTWLTRLL